MQRTSLSVGWSRTDMRSVREFQLPCPPIKPLAGLFYTCRNLYFQADETIQTSWSERTFYLSNDVESRKVKQIQLTAWSEGELPPDDLQFHQFIRHVKEEQTLLENSAGDEHPVIVHCSDGSLRTGLYIGVDQLIHSLDKDSYFDILGVAHKMKSSRNFCLQHEV